MTFLSSHQALTDALMAAPPTVRLRLARPEDAAFIYSLRIDEGLNKHLSSAPESEAGQRAWLEKYRLREDAGSEFYFIIQNKVTDKDCGTVRIYDLRDDSFCWGSWILNADKPRLASVESMMFVYEFGFGLLGFSASHFDVRRGNERVISFHEKTGARRISETEQDIFFSLARADFSAQLFRLVQLTGYPLATLGAGNAAEGMQ